MSNLSAEDLVRNDELNAQADVENEQPAMLPYPKRVFFIIGNEFCFLRQLEYFLLQKFSDVFDLFHSNFSSIHDW